jgi:Zn ribbon nucleic-acid-binding protein
MTTFLRHEPCPSCGSQDNLGVWDDGHKWCFGCGFFVPSSNMSIEQMETALVGKDKNNKNDGLPLDFTHSLPAEPYAWLKQYEITNAEIIQHNLGWSASRQMLIFPYFGENNEVIFWQGRYFPQRKPKSFTGGDFRHLVLVRHHVGTTDFSGGVLTVVEDPVSAIKVSRVCDVHPLFGSNLSQHNAIRLSRYFSELNLWLDFDKTKEALKFAERYKFLFKKVNVISTEKDPKEYGTEQIRTYLSKE